MPTLPTYNSTGNIDTSPAGVERHQAAKPFKDIQGVLDTVSGITDKLSQANDVMQETKAKTHVATALAAQDLAAQNDPNPDNAPEHISAIQDIIKNSPKIDNQEVAGRVKLELEQSGFLLGIKIQDMFKKKQMFANDVSLDQLATTTAQNKANAVSPAAGQQDEDNFMETIQKNVNTGLITPQRGMAIVKQYKDGVVKNQIAQSSSTNPDDYKGLSDGLDFKESAEMQKMVDSHIKQIKERNVSDTFNNRVTILNGIAEKKIDWQSSDKINQIAAKDPALGSALQMVFDAQSKDKTDYEPTSKEGQQYADSVNKLLSGMTVEQVSNYLPTAIEQISKLPAGEMQDRLAVLVNASQDRAKSLPLRDEQEIPPEVIQKEGGIQAVLRWNKEHGDNDPQTLNDYLKNLQSGQTPHEAYTKAVKTKIVKDHPEVAAQKDVPNRIINNNSKLFHIFTGETQIYPARIWNEKLGRFEINPNREQSNDNRSQQTDK